VIIDTFNFLLATVVSTAVTLRVPQSHSAAAGPESSVT